MSSIYAYEDIRPECHFWYINERVVGDFLWD